ncbi:MAG TPA: tyrosine-type recombinase/integrase, partial [Frankiaceae bacterium]|nr:tyrosine-type recombinase/integrase [Frankiaceae bacterium]
MVSSWTPCLTGTSSSAAGNHVAVRLGHELLDDYLEFVAARARRNTVLAVAFDLKVVFSVIGKDPAAVTTTDVLGFIQAQREPRRVNVVRLEDGESGLSARTIKRRLATLSGFYSYLLARGDTAVVTSPVPRGLATRRAGPAGRMVPLIRAPRTLPRVLEPAEVDALTSALRTARDRAMVAAMLLAGLRRCEVLGLRLGDLNPGQRRLFVADGKGGHQRVVPVSDGFFTEAAAYLAGERPAEADTDRLFVVLKGPHRGRPLSPAGVDEILGGARRRGGLAHATCHELRHTCLTRLREAGMALEAVQAQAGHRSIESTRIYLHLSAGW